MFGRGRRVRPLRTQTAEAAIALAALNPLVDALPGARLTELRRAGHLLGEEFCSLGPEEAPTALLWKGANVAPMQADEQALAAFGDHLAGLRRTSSSLVGARADIEQLWERVAPAWGPARELRWSQPLLEALDAPAVEPAAALRPAAVGEASIVYPAAVAMFREEVGSDPTRYDGGRGYLRRVEHLIAQGRTYVIRESGVDGVAGEAPRGGVIFKADVGALFAGVAQIHGVWVDPRYRGQGIARSAMAAVAQQVRRDHAPRVSLYVNDFNEPARRAYAASGFRQAAELSTILF